MRRLLLLTLLPVFGDGVLFSEDRQTKEEITVAIPERMKRTLHFLQFLPEGYENENEKAKWPLVLFLHGAGERGEDLKLVQVHGPPKLVEKKPGNYPFILISPQCPEDTFWDAEQLLQLLDDREKALQVDSSRIYVTGLSMGGYGTWALAAAAPERFAALIPICGGGDPDSAEKFKHIPIWCFHGAKDQAVPLSESEKMIKALKAAKGEPKFTIYEEAEHDSWTETYNNPKVYEWMLEQKKKDKD